MAAFEPKNRPIDVEHYRIQLKIDPSTDPDTFSAQAELTLKTLQALEEIRLDAEDLEVQSVELLQPSASGLVAGISKEELFVRLPFKTTAGQTLKLRLSYQGNIRKQEQAGFFRVFDPDEPDRGPLLFTMFEATSARSFLPCNDEPSDKASTEMEIVVPSSLTAISNGAKLTEETFKEGKKEWRRIHWKQAKPHSTYLMSLAIGPFESLEAKTREGTPVSVWVGKNKKDKAPYALDVTKQSLEFFEDYLGIPYPWDKYATIGIPTYLWGGMENTSSTHMNQERTLLNDPQSSFEKKRIVELVAHEAAHQWFGDLVTMKWWDDLWLNEAFASHLGTLATAHILKNHQEADVELATYTWDSYFRQEDGPRSHPIVDKGLSSVDDSFDAISYTKGENVLRMLGFYVGENNLRKSFKKYLTTLSYRNANYADFLDIVAKESGVNLSGFRDSWLLQRGYPIITYGGSWDEQAKTYRFQLKQRPNHAQDSHTFVFRLPVVFHRKSAPQYSKEILLDVSESEHSKAVSLSAEPEWITVNPGNAVLAKLSMDPIDTAKIVRQALYDEDALGRVWAAYELIRLQSPKNKQAKQMEQAVTEVLSSDPSPYVRIAVLDRLQKIESRWLSASLGNSLFKLASDAQKPEFEKSTLYLSDPHGFSEYRAELLGSLGKVRNKSVAPTLAKLLADPSLRLDDLQRAAAAVAAQGTQTSLKTLRSALKTHEARGYRYKYWVQYAFASYESPMAAKEIENLAKTSGPDLLGRMGSAIEDNHTLKHSKEWSAFLKRFLLDNERFGDEVKARLLQTVEDVKEPHLKSTLSSVAKASKSPRIREACEKILKKNFNG